MKNSDITFINIRGESSIMVKGSQKQIQFCCNLTVNYFNEIVEKFIKMKGN
jgi:hypothetical protein